MATAQPIQNNYGAQAGTAIGGLTSAYAYYTAGRANRKIAQYNARQARLQAAQAIDAGNVAANRQLITAEQAQAAGRAAQAGSGIVVGAGTSAAVEASSEAASSMDRFLIQLNARREAFGYRSRASADEFQGRVAQAEGTNRAVATLLNTGNTVWQESDRTHGNRIHVDGFSESDAQGGEVY